MTRPLRIAVVGHTNTGKTSLMRTLTRDTGFGEVSSRPSTTRHVEGARLLADGYAVLLTIPPNVQYADTFVELERQARGQETGLWGLEGEI